MDNYQKMRVIGKGSYGEVWLVKHKRDRKQYVLKKMEISNASRRERKAAEQEAKLLAKLKHPNICSYKDSFETTDGLLYIAMGYCEGGDLYNRLKEQKGTALEERQVVEWFVQIAMALQYMHERNILHRDLKTQNIFLTKSKIIKVGDLGIARVLDNSNDMATTLIGTPYYMSPELFSNKPYNHKSDVWALGCCVYEMATLKHAFNARDMNSLVYKILRGRMPSMPKQYSPELVTLIRAMLNSNPEKRPSVNRILRDPYIKKNISIFLESTRKHTNKPSNNQRQSADGGGRRPSTESQRRYSDVSTVEDGSESARSSVSSVSSVSGVNKQHSKSRDLPPSGCDSPSRQAMKKKRQRLKRDSDPDRSDKPADRGSSPQRGSHRDSQQNKPAKNNRVLNNAKPVDNPRPLPPRPTPAREPASSAAVPRKSQSRRTAITEKEESGYGSISSSVNSSKDDPGREDETPRQSVNLSARARRREKKESETPRTARSLDVDQRRQDQQVRPRSAGVAKSADYVPHRNREDQGAPRARPRSATAGEKGSGGGRKLPRQPSVTEESSSGSDTEADAAESSGKIERDRKKHVHVEISGPAPRVAAQPPPPPPRGDDAPDGCPQPDNGNEQEEEEEEERKEKEMNNFISLLNTTLHMNSRNKQQQEEEEGGSTGEDEGVDDVDANVIPEETEEGGDGETQPGQQEIVVSNFDYEPIRRPDPSRPHAPDNDVPMPVKTLGTSTRLMDRITALRKDCIRGLGVEKLKKAYDILDEVDGDQLEEELVLVLGRNDFDYYAGKIWQLKFCEEAAFGII